MTGDKNKRITIQRHTPIEQNSLGQEIVTSGYWSDVGTRWASVTPLSGKEAAQAQQMQGYLEHEVRLVYDPTLNITPRDRISYDSRTLEISSVMNFKEASFEYVLRCTEKI
jgi:SPP1 family predicted phage head-tail adaptor